MEDIKRIAEKTKKTLQGAGAQKAQFTVTEKEKHEFNVDGGEFSLFRTLFDRSLSITAYKDNKKGSAFINQFDDSSINSAVMDCIKSAESGIPDEAYDIAPRQEAETFRDGAYEPDMDLFFQRTRELMKDITERHPKIIMEQMIVSHDKVHSVYQNTNGTEFESFTGAYSVSLMFSAHEGETTTSFFGSGVYTDSLDRPFIELGSLEKDLSDTEAQLTTIPMEGKFEGVIVLTPGSLGGFLGSAVSNFVSDGVILEKTSIWLDKLEKQVADSRITISLCPGDSRIVCGEKYTYDGFRSQDYDLIKDGVLKSFMLSLYVSNKSGFAPAKNSSFSVIIEGGDTSYEDMIKNIKKGLIVGRFSGGQPGVNGDFSGVAKNSFLIEDGKVKGAVSETMINGNLAELLNNLVAISRETTADGTTVLPYMAFDKVVISGK
ncbi:TldD/PmbA family protein [bacterium D16-50]|jgi:PmbA protein|nr:TldD/PmbA family protein [Lachnospiraceae bacterium]RKJ20318.1 TldD/PmbA family protein [bacterium D16-50]